jgi:hypothetical protein
MKDEVAFDNELSHPLIGIINSKAVDDVIGKNHLSFADLIQPFACSQISIKVSGLNFLCLTNNPRTLMANYLPKTYAWFGINFFID